MKKNITRDSEWSREVRKRDHNFCMIGFPGCHGNAQQAHHVFGRVLKKLRFDLDDGVSVCSVCHNELESMRANEARHICKKRMGDEWWNRLLDKKRRFYGKNTNNEIS